MRADRNETNSRSFTVAGSFIAFILQVMLAPNIAILDVVPNLIMVFVILNSMRNTNTSATLTGFILGLLYDFISQGALGIMAFVLAIIAYTVSSLNKDLFSGSWIARAFFLLVAAFIGEILNAVFLSVLGFDNDFLLSLGMRVLPGTLYNALFGLIIFPLMSRQTAAQKKDPSTIRGRYR